MRTGLAIRPSPTWVGRLAGAHNGGPPQGSDELVGWAELPGPKHRRLHRCERLELLGRIGLQIDGGSLGARVP